ncbi:KH domain-containing protein [Furfurilactobacillus curtus]|uniref:RNA-binding protein KhpA n=1 Tax=Furfurilactobacillus curtus TaxID=1746200 RepID=A0ABQ5JLA9_9LACO
MNSNQEHRLTSEEVRTFIVTVVSPLVDHPDAITVAVKPGERFTDYALQVDPRDIGAVIGHHGQVAQAIRTVVYSVRTNDHRRVRLLIMDENM